MSLGALLVLASQVAAAADDDGGAVTTGDFVVYASSTLVADDLADPAPLLRGLPDHLSEVSQPAPTQIDVITPLDEAPSFDPRSIAMDAYRAAAGQWPAMGCQGRWSILAAIGHVESSHGWAAGPEVVVGEDGTVTPEILGPVLDGRGYAVVEDTDGGLLDGDDIYDRAVGPMQFMPASWSDHQQDGNGDGIADPHNLYDAASAAAHYLCTARSGNLNGEAALAVALHSYNQSEEYVRLVLDLVDWYDTGRMGTRSGGDGSPTIETAVPFDLDPALFAADDDQPLGILSTAEASTTTAPPEISTTTTTTAATPTTSTTMPIPTTIWMTVLDVTATETNEPTPQRQSATIGIDQEIGIDVEFEWEAVSGTAAVGTDFVAASGRAVIASGSRNASISVDIIGDELFEGDEQFAIEIRPLTAGVQFTDGDRVTVTIVDDDPEPAPTG